MTVQIWVEGSAKTPRPHAINQPANDSREARPTQPQTQAAYRVTTREAAISALLDTLRASDRLQAEARDHRGASAMACQALASRYHARALHLASLSHSLPGEVVQ